PRSCRGTRYRPGRRNAPGGGTHPPHRHRRRPGYGAHRGRSEHPAQARVSLATPALLAVGLLVAAGLAWAAVVVARRRTAALTAAGLTAGGPRGGPGPPRGGLVSI